DFFLLLLLSFSFLLILFICILPLFPFQFLKKNCLSSSSVRSNPKACSTDIIFLKCIQYINIRKIKVHINKIINNTFSHIPICNGNNQYQRSWKKWIIASNPATKKSQTITYPLTKFTWTSCCFDAV